MAEKYWRKKALLAKIEAVYGTDAAPTGAANAMLGLNVNLRPFEGRDVSREIDRPYLGARGSIPVNAHVGLDFEIEMAGSGAAGTAPAYGPLLRACGLAETVTAGVDAAYQPVSESFESATLHLNIDGILHKAAGARGSVGMVVRPSELPRWRFQTLGLWAGPADAALPAVDYSAFETPVDVSDLNTPVATLNGVDLVLQSFEAALNNQVEGRFLVNSRKILLSDRSVSGTLVVEATALAALNPFTLAQAPKTRVPLAITHGTVAGNIVEISMPTVELGRPSYGNTQGITNWTIPFTAIPSDAGDDEISITVK